MRPARALVVLSLAILSNEKGEFISVAILPAPITSRKPDQALLWLAACATVASAAGFLIRAESRDASLRNIG